MVERAGLDPSDFFRGTAWTRCFFWGGALLVAVPTILGTPILMYFSRGDLTFLQSLRIVAASFAIMVGAILVFVLGIEPVIGTAVSGPAILLCVCLAGSLITRLAVREGVTKTGWLGVGAKTVLSLLALVWAAVGVMHLAGVDLRLS